MSKKSRKNSPKAAAPAVTGRAAAGKAAAVAAAAAKRPARKSAAAASKPAAKSAAKTTPKSAVKTGARSAAKANAKAAAKAPAKAGKSSTKPAAKSAGKAATKPVAKATAKPATRAKTEAAGRPAKTELAPAARAPAKTARTVAPAKTETKAKAKPAAIADTGAAPGTLEEGAAAPAFQLPRDGGTTVSLADHAGRKLAIFFYPRAGTPGCTKEAIDFTRLAKDFEAAGTAVLGVSADSVKAQESFRDKYALGVPLLSDDTHGMLAAYGAWGEKMMYGKSFEGVLRTTVLIGADGRVARIWRGVKVDGHADAVLEEARRI